MSICVVFYDKPFLKFERLLETYLAFAPRGFGSFRQGDAALAQGQAVSEESAASRDCASIDPDFDAKPSCFSPSIIMRMPPALSIPSPFEEAVVLTMDGVGEWATTAVALGDGNRLD